MVNKTLKVNYNKKLVSKSKNTYDIMFGGWVDQKLVSLLISRGTTFQASPERWMKEKGNNFAQAAPQNTYENFVTHLL